MSKTTTPPEDALAPFNDPSANAILRSADNVDFRIHAVILSIASPVFKDMFSLPRPAATTVDETRDGLPVVILTESERTLDLFLRILYPIQSPEVTELADIRALLEVSRKYLIEAFVPAVRSGLASALNREPVGAFALSLSYGLNDFAATAARHCLRLPISSLDSPELKYISADQYRRLLQFHFDASKILSAVLDRTSWFQLVDGVVERKSIDWGGSGRCRHCWVSVDGEWTVRQVVMEYILRARLALQASLGVDALISKDVLPSAARIRSCSDCSREGLWQVQSNTVDTNFARFTQIMKAAVEAAILSIPPPSFR